MRSKFASNSSLGLFWSRISKYYDVLNLTKVFLEPMCAIKWGISLLIGFVVVVSSSTSDAVWWPKSYKVLLPLAISLYKPSSLKYLTPLPPTDKLFSLTFWENSREKCWAKNTMRPQDSLATWDRRSFIYIMITFWTALCIADMTQLLSWASSKLSPASKRTYFNFSIALILSPQSTAKPKIRVRGWSIKNRVMYLHLMSLRVCRQFWSSLYRTMGIIFKLMSAWLWSYTWT